MSKLRLMSHNIWNCDNNNPDWEKNGEDCSAEARVGGLLRVWRECDPDVIGMQEASAKMCDLVKTGFEEEGKNYILVWGRFTPILFKADKFELVDGEFVTYHEHIYGYDGCFNDVRSKSCNVALYAFNVMPALYVLLGTDPSAIPDPVELGTFDLITIFGKVFRVLDVCLPLYAVLTMVLVPVIYREFRRKQIQ